MDRKVPSDPHRSPALRTPLGGAENTCAHAQVAIAPAHEGASYLIGFIGGGDEVLKGGTTLLPMGQFGGDARKAILLEMWLALAMEGLVVASSRRRNRWQPSTDHR